MNKLKLLLVEDEQRDCDAFSSAIQKYSNSFEFLGCCKDVNVSLQIIKNKSPDILILDLELHHGIGGSGLSLLKLMQSESLSPKPYVLITTNNISSTTHNLARNLGADYIFTKTQTDYSPELVLDFLLLINSSSNSDKSHTAPVLQQVKREDKNYKLSLRAEVSEYLNKLGVNPSNIGYKYLIEGIILTLNGPVNHLCLEIAKIYKKSEKSVERAMQNAINRVWSTVDYDTLFEQYTARIRSERGVPSVVEFVYYYANKISNSRRNN